MSTIIAKGVGPAKQIAAGNSLSVTLVFGALDYAGSNGEETAHIELHRSVMGRGQWINVKNYPVNVDVAEYVELPQGGLSYDFRIVVPFVVDCGDVAETLAEVANVAVEDLLTQREAALLPLASVATEVSVDPTGWAVLTEDNVQDLFAETDAALDANATAISAHVSDATAAHAASAVAFTQGVGGDWTGATADVAAALDQLAARLNVLEP